MKIEQIYTGCLSQAAYYIESNGEAAIIDPLREVQQYITMAENENVKIKYIFETHFHADFVSGHKDLAQKTGAQIVYGPTSMSTGFDFIAGTDGQQFKIGNITLTLIHTPGHTMESSCFLLTDENGIETALFSGDTLFIGDVGRPDLAQHVIADLTQEKLAGYLFESLRNKIMPLNDSIIVYPAHGAGSACGKNLSDENSDTLGNQKATNYALNMNLTKDQFIKEVLTGLAPPPSYFPKNVLMNINGYDAIDDVLQRGTKALSCTEFELLANETKALILDTRPPDKFVQGYIPNAINIGLDGSFAVWVGTLITDIKQQILLITEPNTELEVITRLARVGYDHAIGYLQGGFNTWKNSGKEIATIKTISVDEFFTVAEHSGNMNHLDVRKRSEYFSEHLDNSVSAPLDVINESMLLINKNKTYYIHCTGGYRSVIFISILKARGYTNLINVTGGFNAMKASDKFKVSDYMCPTKMV